MATNSHNYTEQRQKQHFTHHHQSRSLDLQSLLSLNSNTFQVTTLAHINSGSSSDFFSGIELSEKSDAAENQQFQQQYSSTGIHDETTGDVLHVTTGHDALEIIHVDTLPLITAASFWQPQQQQQTETIQVANMSNDISGQQRGSSKAQQQQLYDAVSIAEMQQQQQEQEQEHFQRFQQQQRSQHTTTLSIFEEHQRQQQQQIMISSELQCMINSVANAPVSNFTWTQDEQLDNAVQQHQQLENASPTTLAYIATAESQFPTRRVSTTTTTSSSSALMYELLPPTASNDSEMSSAGFGRTFAANSITGSGGKIHSRSEGHIDRRTRRGKRKLACRTTAITTYPPQPQAVAAAATTHSVVSNNSYREAIQINNSNNTVAVNVRQQQVLDDADADDEDLRDHRTVFCSTFGRLNLMNAKERHDVSRAELKRRLAPPECLNMSLLSGILRRAKTKNGGPAFRARLERSGLIVNAGRRPSARVTLFTSLLEAESVMLARDYVQVLSREFPARPLAEHLHNCCCLQLVVANTNKRHAKNDSNNDKKATEVSDATENKHEKSPAHKEEENNSIASNNNNNVAACIEVEVDADADAVYWHERHRKLLASAQVLSELRVMLEDDRSPVTNRRPPPLITSSAAAHNSLCRFSNLTHGFGITAIVGALKPLEESIALMASMAQTKAAEQALSGVSV